MKKTVFVILVILVAIQSVGLSQKKFEKKRINADTVSADSMEYRLIILNLSHRTQYSMPVTKRFLNLFSYISFLFLFLQPLSFTAQMAKLVDALVSGTSVSNDVQVRVLFWAQKRCNGVITQRINGGYRKVL